MRSQRNDNLFLTKEKIKCVAFDGWNLIFFYYILPTDLLKLYKGMALKVCKCLIIKKIESTYD